jgi:hypothetical protein
MARFRIAKMPYYREGRLFFPGEIVDIPDNEKPSRYWTPVDDPAPAAAPPAPKQETPRAPRRTADLDPTLIKN